MFQIDIIADGKAAQERFLAIMFDGISEEEIIIMKNVIIRYWKISIGI